MTDDICQVLAKGYNSIDFSQTVTVFNAILYLKLQYPFELTCEVWEKENCSAAIYMTFLGRI